MSCLGQYYLPVPPRVWSRVENLCAYTNSDSVQSIPGDYINLPYSATPILKSQYYYQLYCLKKGNVLQYKANSSNLTKQQRYAQIAKGMWVNRNTTWASQSETFSEPNTKSLKRVNYFNITTDGVPTVDPLTCSLPAKSTNSVLPQRSTSSQSNAPAVPPLSSNTGQGPIMPPSVLPAVPIAPTVIPDGGSLVCNIVQNICTGEIIEITASNNCFPTSASDVPGTPILLCYNESLPTTYPKTRLTYPAAGGKWPQGAKFIQAANTTQPFSQTTTSTNETESIVLDNYNIYTIDSLSTDDFIVGNIGIYMIYNFNGQNIILPIDKQNLSFYTFFNSTSKAINLQSPNESIYFYNEFYSSKNGVNNVIIGTNQASTLTSVVSSDKSKITYFADFNVIQSGAQESNANPVITYINNNTTNNNYPISTPISDYYIINNYTSTGFVILDDTLPNLTIIKFYNLSNNPVTISSSSLIYNTYYIPLSGETNYSLDSFNHYAFQLIQTENTKIWIMNSNNIRLNSVILNGPYYITNVIGDFTVSENTVYIVESITGNIIIPNLAANLSNIKIFNISKNTVQIQTSSHSTFLCNDFFAPMKLGGLYNYALDSNLAIQFQFMNITNTTAQKTFSTNFDINLPFWTFTIS
uniref:Uncharacterized protein n=1 Tax=viral metagenome TaxID=1070528 RepID=A0A6C0BA09_9ZZZZ